MSDRGPQTSLPLKLEPPAAGGATTAPWAAPAPKRKVIAIDLTLSESDSSDDDDDGNGGFGVPGSGVSPSVLLPSSSPAGVTAAEASAALDSSPLGSDNKGGDRGGGGGGEGSKAPPSPPSAKAHAAGICLFPSPRRDRESSDDDENLGVSEEAGQEDGDGATPRPSAAANDDIDSKSYDGDDDLALGGVAGPALLRASVARIREGFPRRRQHERLESWEGACSRFFRVLMRHRWISGSEPKFSFHVPVPVLFPSLKGAYEKKIDNPMDLTTAECKLLQGGIYMNPKEFVDDIALVFANAITFNRAGHDEGEPLSCAYFDSSCHLLRYTRWLSLECLSPFLADDDRTDPPTDEGLITTWKITKGNKNLAREEMNAIVMELIIEKSDEEDQFTWMETECDKLLKSLRHQIDLKYMQFFICPNYPADYTAYVSKPMDWEKVQQMLRSRRYTTFGEVVEDLRLVFSNALKYNARGQGTDTVGGSIYAAANYMSMKLEAAIGNMLLSVSERVEREKIDRLIAERKSKVAHRAEEEQLRTVQQEEREKNRSNVEVGDGHGPPPPPTLSESAASSNGSIDDDASSIGGETIDDEDYDDDDEVTLLESAGLAVSRAKVTTSSSRPLSLSSFPPLPSSLAKERDGSSGAEVVAATALSLSSSSLVLSPLASSAPPGGSSTAMEGKGGEMDVDSSDDDVVGGGKAAGGDDGGKTATIAMPSSSQPSPQTEDVEGNGASSITVAAVALLSSHEGRLSGVRSEGVDVNGRRRRIIAQGSSSGLSRAGATSSSLPLSSKLADKGDGFSGAPKGGGGFSAPQRPAGGGADEAMDVDSSNDEGGLGGGGGEETEGNSGGKAGGASHPGSVPSGGAGLTPSTSPCLSLSLSSLVDGVDVLSCVAAKGAMPSGSSDPAVVVDGEDGGKDVDSSDNERGLGVGGGVASGESGRKTGDASGPHGVQSRAGAAPSLTPSLSLPSSSMLLSPLAEDGDVSPSDAAASTATEARTSSSSSLALPTLAKCAPPGGAEATVRPSDKDGDGSVSSNGGSGDEKGRNVAAAEDDSDDLSLGSSSSSSLGIGDSYGPLPGRGGGSGPSSSSMMTSFPVMDTSSDEDDVDNDNDDGVEVKVMAMTMSEGWKRKGSSDSLRVKTGADAVAAPEAEAEAEAPPPPEKKQRKEDDGSKRAEHPAASTVVATAAPLSVDAEAIAAKTRGEDATAAASVVSADGTRSHGADWTWVAMSDFRRRQVENQAPVPQEKQSQNPSGDGAPAAVALAAGSSGAPTTPVALAQLSAPAKVAQEEEQPLCQQPRGPEHGSIPQPLNQWQQQQQSRPRADRVQQQPTQVGTSDARDVVAASDATTASRPVNTDVHRLSTSEKLLQGRSWKAHLKRKLLGMDDDDDDDGSLASSVLSGRGVGKEDSGEEKKDDADALIDLTESPSKTVDGRGRSEEREISAAGASFTSSGSAAVAALKRAEAGGKSASKPAPHSNRSYQSDQQQNEDGETSSNYSGRSSALHIKDIALPDGKPPGLHSLGLSFLSSLGYGTAQAFVKADPNSLAQKLFDSPTYKIGCALTAWRLHCLLSSTTIFQLALATVKRWQKDALSKWREMCGRSVGSSPLCNREQWQNGMDLTDSRGEGGAALSPSASLQTLLTSSDCCFLRTMGIHTCADLLGADDVAISRKLRSNLERDWGHRIKDGFSDGVVYAWATRVRERVESSESDAAGDKAAHGWGHGVGESTKLLGKDVRHGVAETVDVRGKTGNSGTAGKRMSVAAAKRPYRESMSKIPSAHFSATGDVMNKTARPVERQCQMSKSTHEVKAFLQPTQNGEVAGPFQQRAQNPSMVSQQQQQFGAQTYAARINSMISRHALQQMTSGLPAAQQQCAPVMKEHLVPAPPHVPQFQFQRSVPQNSMQTHILPTGYGPNVQNETPQINNLVQYPTHQPHVQPVCQQHPSVSMSPRLSPSTNPNLVVTETCSAPQQQPPRDASPNRSLAAATVNCSTQTSPLADGLANRVSFSPDLLLPRKLCDSRIPPPAEGLKMHGWKTKAPTHQEVELLCTSPPVAADLTGVVGVGPTAKINKVAEKPQEFPAPRNKLCEQLSTSLSRQDALFLSSCGATSASRLLALDGRDLVEWYDGFRKKNGIFAPESAADFVARLMMSAWKLCSLSEDSSSCPAAGGKKIEPERMVTPMSYADLRFLKSRDILTDRQLITSNQTELIASYDRYRARGDWTVEKSAADVVSTWLRNARKVLNVAEEGIQKLAEATVRHDDGKKEDPPLMDNVKHLCQTQPDPETGFPRRKITVFDCKNEVLYDFLVTVRDSNIPGAGRGAFLTFCGARVLRPGTKRQLPRSSPHLTRTRQSLQATLPGIEMGFTVNLRGEYLHGDEHLFGAENGVGMFREYDVERDFIPALDNVSFYSRDEGSGLVELGRYAPLVKEDRKTDTVFAVKDFIFSYEPSSWRFDVPEDLHGCPQVVDFTDDGTGEPHEMARKNVPMYVNEVGHNPELSQNVVSRDDYRSVSYYLLLDEPLQKGQTVELLVHYLEGYEEMRVRKGYGKANIHSGVKCDKDDFARLQRNLKERAAMEKHIQTYNVADVDMILDFISKRVLDTLVKDTTSFFVKTKSNNGESDGVIHEEWETVFRQWVARRRLHWISSRIGSQLQILSSRYRSDDRNESMRTQCSTNSHGHRSGCFSTIPFRKGMFVYVNGWSPDFRPEFSGIASIESVTELASGERTYDIALEGNKQMLKVPEAVLTHPTEDEVNSSSRRMQLAWKRWKEREEWPFKYQRMLSVLKNMEWDRAQGDVIFTQAHSYGKLFDVMNKEFSEEALFTLAQKKLLFNPFDRADWCPLSTTVMRTMLKQLTLLSLSDNPDAHRNKVLKTLLKHASDAANIIREQAVEKQKLLTLAFKAHGAQEPHVVAVDPNLPESPEGVQVPVKRVARGEAELHVQWYLVSQVISVTDSIASLVEDPTTSSHHATQYSFEALCNAVGVHANTAAVVLRDIRDCATRLKKADVAGNICAHANT